MQSQAQCAEQGSPRLVWGVVLGCVKSHVSWAWQVSSDETERLIKMEETLHQRVIGQEEAVVAISRAIRRARVGLKNPNRPIASFIFSGPTGVGKSELAKTLASYYFGSQEAMVRLDMSEFMERHTVSKLIGSPPGTPPATPTCPPRDVGRSDSSPVTALCLRPH